MNQLFIKKLAVIAGAVMLFLISPYVSSLFSFIPHINMPSKTFGITFPGTFLILIIPILLKKGAYIFIPVFFVILSIFFDKKNYIYFFTALVTILIMLDAIWIISSLFHGIPHPIIDFVTAVIIENTVSFLLIYTCLVLYFKWPTFLFLYLSALFLCLTLNFFAFPWLEVNT